MGLVEAIYAFLLELPNWLGVDPERQEFLASGHFWYRQCFHLAGGLLLGLALWRAGARAYAGAVPPLALLLVLHEGHDLGWCGQSVWKTAVDGAMWTAGYAGLVPLLTRAPVPFRRNAGAVRPPTDSAPTR